MYRQFRPAVTSNTSQPDKRASRAFAVFMLSITGWLANGALAAGDLTRQEPIELVVELGVGGRHAFSPDHLEFETGKLYRLVLVNNSNDKHYFTSIEFANRVFTRKVQVMETVDGKLRRTAEIKGDIREIEVFPGHRAEWWLVPVQTGELNDLHCHVEDDASNLTHAEMGMTGTITIR